MALSCCRANFPASPAHPVHATLRPIAIVRSILERTWWLLLLIIIGGTLFFAAAIPRLDINANTDAFIEEESTGVSTYYEAREEWGTDEFAVLCVTADDWFTPEGIVRLKDLESDLKQAPFVASTVSVLDIPLLRQEPEKKPNLLFLARGIKTLRDRDADLTRAAEELKNHELAVGNLISADGRSVNLIAYLDWTKNPDGTLTPDINTRRTELVAGVRKVAAMWNERLDAPVRLSGIPIIQITLYDNMREDMIVFGIASFLLFSLAFLVAYRRLRFVLIPITCCLIPPVAMVGGMAFFDVPIGFVTSNMPVLLFVLMLPYSVYFIERYRERRIHRPGEDGFASTLAALRSIAVPCAYSCATTLAGFVALGMSRIIPIRDFGESMTIGIALGFVLVFVFIATVSRHLPALTFRGKASHTYDQSRGLVRLFERLALARPGMVVATSVLVLAAAVGGTLRISADSKFTSYFWPSSEVYQGLEFIDQTMGGTTWIEVLLTSEEKGHFRTDEGLRQLELAQSYFDTVPETGNIMSLVNVRDEIRKTLRPEWFPKLSDSNLLRIIRLASPDLVEQTTAADYRSSRITVRMMETAPGLDRNRILDGLSKHMDTNSAAFDGLQVEVTGVFPVYTQMINQLLKGQKDSILIVAGAVFVMLLLLFRSPVMALLVLVPQAVPAAVVLGIIGWAGIPLDLVTVMIASIAIGVGIDATIQYTLRFRAELETTGDPREAIRRAHSTIGRAIWIATTIIIAGFAILVLSNFFPSVWFGLFTALAMLISQLATLTLLPSLLLLRYQPGKHGL
jgi:predicted RND superfamily exporter protein